METFYVSRTKIKITFRLSRPGDLMKHNLRDWLIENIGEFYPDKSPGWWGKGWNIITSVNNKKAKTHVRVRISSKKKAMIAKLVWL